LNLEKSKVTRARRAGDAEHAEAHQALVDAFETEIKASETEMKKIGKKHDKMEKGSGNMSMIMAGSAILLIVLGLACFMLFEDKK